MNEIYTVALQVQRFCEGRNWRFCVIGGLAVHRWGEVRATKDVDLTLLTGFGHEEAFIDEWLTEFCVRPPCDKDFALRHRVLLLRSPGGTNVDVALGGFEFEERSIARSSVWLAGGQHMLRTCSAEDLIVHKCFANRDRDWTDVDGVLARQWGKLDLDLVRAELKPLLELKGEPENAQRLEKLIARHAQPFQIIKPTRSAT